MFTETPKVPPRGELLILWALHGSGSDGVCGIDIQRAIAECSRGAETMSSGSLYSLLKRLKGKGYIKSYESATKRHYYFLTAAGNNVMAFSNSVIAGLCGWTASETEDENV